MEHGRLKRGLKRSTLKNYRQALDRYVLRDLGDRPLRGLGEEEIERWHSRFPRSRTGRSRSCSVGPCSAKLGWLDVHPSTGVERYPVRYSGDYDFYSPEDVQALVRAAATEQDAVLFLTAAMTGLRRGELLALTWRDVDFAREAIGVRRNLAMGELTTPNSGRVRVVPMVAQVAGPLARLAQRDRFTSDQDFVFGSPTGRPADPSAVRRRYHQAVKTAGLRALPFHSLRHHLWSIAVNRASLVQVQAWLGHADIQTTARYLHHRAQTGDIGLRDVRLCCQRCAGRDAHALGSGADGRGNRRSRLHVAAGARVCLPGRTRESRGVLRCAHHPGA